MGLGLGLGFGSASGLWLRFPGILTGLWFLSQGFGYARDMDVRARWLVSEVEGYEGYFPKIIYGFCIVLKCETTYLTKAGIMIMETVTVGIMIMIQ